MLDAQKKAGDVVFSDSCINAFSRALSCFIPSLVGGAYLKLVYYMNRVK